MACPEWFNIKVPNEEFFLLSNRCYDHCKNVFYPFLKHQLSVKHIPSSKSCNLLFRTMTEKMEPERSKLLKEICHVQKTSNIFIYFYPHLPYICWVDVIYLTCLIFLKSLWWLFWIFCAPTSLHPLCYILNVRSLSFSIM